MNCWKAKLKNKPISSQASQGCDEGSETRTWRLEQPVKSHECATTYMVEDIVRYSSEMVRGKDKEPCHNKMWGTVNFMPSRQNRSRDVFICQDDMWSVAVLRNTKNMELAKTSDSTRRAIVTELTLVSNNEKASGGVFDNTTS